MKIQLFISAAIAILTATNAFSQNDTTIDGDKKMIRKERKMIVVDVNNITINGKPVENIEELKSQLSRDGNFRIEMPDGKMTLEYPFNKAFLGVQTKKDEKGALIVEITKESPAEKAGLRKGDIITTINDTKIADDQALYNVIGKYKPEEKITIGYIRDGVTYTTNAILSKNKREAVAFNYQGFGMPENFPSNRLKNYPFLIESNKPRLGIQVQDLEEGNGVKIITVREESPAAKAGLQANDIITEINSKEVKDVDDIKTKTKDIKAGETYLIKFKREGKIQSISLKIPKNVKMADL